MNRQISLALIAAALIVVEAGSAQAKPSRSPEYKAANSVAKVPTQNIESGYGVKPVQVYGTTGAAGKLQPIYHVPVVAQQPVFGIPPLGHGPVILPKPTTPVTWGGNPPRAPQPTTPVTWGGNPPRAPKQGCDHDGCHDHDGCYGHNHCHDRFWWGGLCFNPMFMGYYGDCDGCWLDFNSDLCQ